MFTIKYQAHLMILNLNKIKGGIFLPTEDMIINSEGKELYLEHLYTVEDYFTFNIRVKSGDFSGASNFCMPKTSIISLIDNLEKMYTKLKGRSQLTDSDSDAYVRFEMENLGHMSISGQIGGSHQDHYMKFAYTVDQTVLRYFIQVLKRIL